MAAHTLFVTATGTDAGKTYLSALILKSLRASAIDCAYFKAAQSGCHLATDGTVLEADSLYVWRTAGLQQKPDSLCPFSYAQALSPLAAGQASGCLPDLKRIRKDFHYLRDKHDYVLMEGAGGILCPITQNPDGSIVLQDQLIKELQLPVIIVSEAGLGCINSLLLSLFYLKSQGIPCRAIFLNRFCATSTLHQDNHRTLTELTGLKVYTISESAQQLSLPPLQLSELFAHGDSRE